MPTYSEFAYNCDVYNQADLYVLDGNSITEIVDCQFWIEIFDPSIRRQSKSKQKQSVIQSFCI